MSDQPADPAARIDAWLGRRANGEWEHGYGLELETTDNPGFLLTIHIEETPLAGTARKFPKAGTIEIEIHQTGNRPEKPNKVGGWMLWAYCHIGELSAMLTAVADILESAESKP